MEVTMAQMAAHLRRRHDESRAKARDRARQLNALVPKATQLLVDHYGVQQIWVFGSLVHGDPSADCDVDLAVQGLASRDYFRALADLMHCFGVAVDLVRMEEAPASLRDRILEEGSVQ